MEMQHQEFSLRLKSATVNPTAQAWKKRNNFSLNKKILLLLSKTAKNSWLKSMIIHGLLLERAR
jgi:hypothetical protein